MNTIKPQDIERIVKDNQYKYIELMNNEGKPLAHFNNRPVLLNEKIKNIKDLLSKKPDGLYYINFKLSPKGDVWQYVYNKGNVNLNEQPAPIFINTPAANNIEKFQTLDEWKRQEKLISELQQKIALLEMQQNFNGVEEEEEEEPSMLKGFAENILPTFMPIVDKYLSLKEREIDMNEKRATRPMIRKVPKFRPVPDLNDQNFGAYEVYFSKLSDQAASSEMNFLESNKPNVYEYLNRKYYETSDEI